VPLSLLEAVRDADRPEGAAEAEYVPELLNKRLGTTDTVYTQIRRYTDAVKRGHPIGGDEVTAIARLLSRRPDALELFRAAGRATARTAYNRLSSLKRACVRHLPRFIARPLARRQARRIVSRYFGASLRRNAQSLHMDVPSRAPVAVGADEAGRAYYDAALDELLSLLSLP
jgi:hypothetical protein